MMSNAETATASALTREAFLAARKLPVRRVELDNDLYGDGAHVYVRAMTGRDRSEFEKRWQKKRAAADPGAFRWDLIQRTACDQDGNLLFKEADGSQAMEQDAGTIERIFEAACFLNGLRDEDIEELAKNSESSQ